MSGVIDVEGVRPSETLLPTAAGDSAGTDNVTNKMVAPVLRVEELKDEAGVLESPVTSDYATSEDGISDQDFSGTESSSLSSKRSGKIPAHELEFVTPDGELVEKIVNQVEFYFSDANIVKDAFLLKHVKRNKLGFVSLKLITSFKKVKSLTKDYRVVAYSIKQSSEKLEVNEEGSKVRRLEPLPEYDETTPSRTVVAVNLPIENPSIEKVAELFSKCGEVILIRILRPGKPIPQDVKKHHSKHPEIGNSLCAVVEFENHDAAKKACETMSSKDDWRNGLRVVFLANKKEQKRKETKSDVKKELIDVKSAGEGDENKKKKKSGKRKNSRVEELRDLDSASSSSEAEHSDCQPEGPRIRAASEGHLNRSPRSSLSPVPDQKFLSPKSSPKTSPAGSPRSSPRGSPTSRRKQLGRSPLASDLSPKNSPKASPRHTPQGSPEMSRKRGDSEGQGSSPSSPWVQRRLRAAQQQQQQELASSSAANSPGTSPLVGRHQMNIKMVGVLRQPKGPDGSSGFAAGRGKLRSETV